MNIILASGSPRRKELLHHIFKDFAVITSDADEHIPGEHTPEELVAAIARRKGEAVFRQGHEQDLVISADTIVVVDGRVLGKPADEENACEMLRLLAGRDHVVYTAVQLLSPMGEQAILCGTTVHFNPMSEEEIRAYVATGEPMDKAGAYGIQGFGSRYIRGVEGDYFNVMGLPVSRLYQAVCRWTEPTAC